jgi:lipopolysaccharide transport system ATP-binding protein
LSTVIRIENLSKQYRLGEVSTGSLAHDINRWWHRVRGNEDPYLRIGDENGRIGGYKCEYVWALKDIDLDIRQGEVLGIIGRNGAGKSTLLKILSRTTAPTLGAIKIRGRVASLLEVGTGFHPELTGKDNIFLNGAILGMTRREITRKFDEIVEFSGVEKYIYTPVKRYSSGMYVRLAFAVAAHLEPDILIVDEVLAVGDADFQKRCLGKMKEVSDKEGRTVIFVSHNMIAIKSLCNRAIYLMNGQISESGLPNIVVNTYLSHHVNSSLLQSFKDPEHAPGNDKAKLKRVEICPRLKDPTDMITVRTPIDVEIEFWNFENNKLINLTIFVNTLAGEAIFAYGSEAKNLSIGLHKAVCLIPSDYLNDEIYSVSVMIVGDVSYPISFFENIVTFEVNEERKTTGWHGKWPGLVRPILDFRFSS